MYVNTSGISTSVLLSRVCGTKLYCLVFGIDIPHFKCIILPVMLTEMSFIDTLRNRSEQFRISRVCACLERPGRAVRQLIALCVDTRERHHNARETVEIVYRVFSVSSKFSRIRREQLGKGFLDNVRHVTAFFQAYPEKVNKPDGNNKPRCYILFLWRFKILLTETPWKL